MLLLFDFSRLKLWWWQHRAGSIPALGTTKNKGLKVASFNPFFMPDRLTLSPLGAQVSFWALRPSPFLNNPMFRTTLFSACDPATVIPTGQAGFPTPDLVTAQRSGDCFRTAPKSRNISYATICHIHLSYAECYHLSQVSV